MFKQIKQRVSYECRNSIENERQFVGQLPIKLRTKINLFIYEDRYWNIPFIQNKSDLFISWICPLLKLHHYPKRACVFEEGDKARSIYFMKQGCAAYMVDIWHAESLPFVTVSSGHMIGGVDIIGSSEKLQFDVNQWASFSFKIKRTFTVRA